jgi:hypothetical protein
MAEASASNRLFAADALLPTGWARDVLLAWDAQGRLTGVVPASAAPAGVRSAASCSISASMFLRSSGSPPVMPTAP